MNTRILSVIITAAAALVSNPALAQQAEGQSDPAPVVSETTDTSDTSDPGLLDEMRAAEVTESATMSWQDSDVQTNPDSGTVSVKGASSFKVYVGLTEVGAAPIDIPLMKGTWVISAVADGYKLWSTRVKVKPGKTTTVKIKEKKVSDIDACRALWISLNDQATSAGKNLNQGFGMGQSINPVQADLMALVQGVGDIAGREMVCGSDDNDSSVETTCNPAGPASKLVKASVRGQWVSDATRCHAVLLETTGVDPARKVTASAGGNVYLYNGAEAVCSARMTALAMAMMNRWGLGHGAEYRGMTKSFMSADDATEDPQVAGAKNANEVVDITQTFALDVANNVNIGPVSIEVKSGVLGYRNEHSAGDKAEKEELWRSVVKIGTRAGDRAVSIFMYQGNIWNIAIESVPGAGVCAGVDTLVSMLKEGGVLVEIKNLPDSPFGAPMSEVTLETP